MLFVFSIVPVCRIAIGVSYKKIIHRRSFEQLAQAVQLCTSGERLPVAEWVGSLLAAETGWLSGVDSVTRPD